MHVGPPNSLCPELKVHDSIMKLVSEDTYLGDVVRADGRNSSNVQQRVSKGIGLISQIMRILETISFGKSYFQIALRLREAIFLNGILTNSEIWYGLTRSEIEELESVDRLLLRRILSLPISTPKEALYLETGCADIETVIKGRRIKYLHYLANCDKNSMQYKFFKAQWDFPAKGDWTRQVQEDLSDFDIEENLSLLEEVSKASFKTRINKTAKEYSLEKFRKLKLSHSKMKNLYYPELNLQSYLKLNELNVDECKTILLWRLRMAKFGANYGDKSKLCPLCSEHEDSQEMFYKQCSVAKEAVEITSKYEEIFSGNPSKKLIGTIKKLTKLREDHQVHSS